MPPETHSHRSPVARHEVSRVVRERLAEILEVDDDAVRADARLRDDLHADDFALIEWAEAIEDELGERTVGFKLDDDDLAERDTVADAIDCVVARLESGANAGAVAELPVVEPDPTLDTLEA